MLRWLPILLVAAASTAASCPAIERLGKPSVNGARLPFSDAVRVGDLLFLSGQIGIAADGKIPAGIDAQARRTMDNIAGILTRSGLGWGDVVKCTVMLDDMADWPAFNTVYRSYFPGGEFPARSAFGADGLALGALVEVECIAHVPARAK
ncbi:MAG: RidA family protein [Sphingomicrobium sp.]